LLQVLAKKQPGDVVRLDLRRDGKPAEAKVTLERRNRLFREP
jgi:S1-C subfamily serine protease